MTAEAEPVRADPLGELCERIGHTFRDPSLLEQALSHRSWCAEHLDAPSNERLEFLGDAVLGWVVADLVFTRFDGLHEGQLTDVRKAVVNALALAEVAEALRLGEVVRLGKGENAAGGRSKTSILADVFEAVLGAIYLDAGAGAAAAFVERFIGPGIDGSVAMLGRLDHKTALQETAAEQFDGAPRYVLTDSGPDHAKSFYAEVHLDGRVLGAGEGRSKKQAEQAAARAALAALAVEAGD